MSEQQKLLDRVTRWQEEGQKLINYNKIRDYRDKLVRDWTGLLNEEIALQMATDAYAFFEGEVNS